jgi:methionyl-tRNA formyltransferase
MNWGLIIKDSMWSRSVLAQTIVENIYPRHVIALPRNDQKPKARAKEYARMLKRIVAPKYKESKYGSTNIAKSDIFDLLRSFDEKCITYSNNTDIHSKLNQSFISSNPDIEIWIIINCGILNIEIFPVQLKLINLHQGYLPGTRGTDSNYWPFITNKLLGVSSHYITKSIDGGNVICRVDIDKNLDVSSHIHYSYIVAKQISKIAILTIKTLSEQPDTYITNQSTAADYYFPMHQTMKDIIIANIKADPILF